MAFITEENRKWWLLGAVGCVLGLILLDETVVGVALPTIEAEFGLSLVEAHWVVNAYLLVFACFVPVGGKLADRYGVLRFFLLGLAIFGVFSALAGFSASGEMLIAARAIQGLGAAIIFPLFIAMTTLTFASSERGFALGIGGAIGTVFLAVGPFVGGLLTDVLSWRWIFWINPPVVLFIALVTMGSFRDIERNEQERIDWLGLTLIAGGLFLFVFALMQSSDWGWSDPVIWICLLAGSALLVAFAVVELRRRAPLLEVALFRNTTFAGSNLVILTAQYSKMAIFIFAALYLQKVVGLSPLAAGSTVMLAAITQPFVAPFCGRLTDRMPPRLLILTGLVFLIAGTGWMALATPFENVYLFAPGLIVWGISMPFVFIPTQVAIMGSLPEEQHGEGGGIAVSSQIVGGALGLAICSAVYSAAGSYQAVFFSNALFLLGVLAVSWAWIGRPFGSATSRQAN